MSTYFQGVSGVEQTPYPTLANAATQQLRYLVTRMTCEHCRVAITEELHTVAGVASVDVDLDTKLVTVHGSDVDGEAVVAAIDEAGYDAVTA
jgi:copper chaperone